MKIILKIGTQSLLSVEEGINKNVIGAITKLIVALQKEHDVILVTSGAVGLGRYITKNNTKTKYESKAQDKQLLASIGQSELMKNYRDEFAKHNKIVSQLLLTKYDFTNYDTNTNLYKLLKLLFKNKDIVPIVNENDSVVIDELMFTDNDELSGYLCKMLNADRLIILTNVEGVYTGNPSDADAKLIHVIEKESDYPQISTDKSGAGRGGMFSKLNVARDLAEIDIITHIISVTQLDKIKDVLAGDESIGTTIKGFK